MKPYLFLLSILVCSGPLGGQTHLDLGWFEAYEDGTLSCTPLIPWLVDLRQVQRRGQLEIQVTAGTPRFLILTAQNRRGHWSQTPAYLPLGLPEPNQVWTLDLETLWQALEEDPDPDFRSGGLLRMKMELWGRGDPSQGNLLQGRGVLKNLAP